MRTFLTLLCAAMCLLSAWTPRLAQACSPVQPIWSRRPWTVTDAADETPPSTAPVITGSASAPEASEGCGSGDLSSDPGDCSTLGSVTIHIEEHALDERTAARDMAYRVEIVSGDSPFPTDVPIYTVEPNREPDTITAIVSRAKLNLKLRVIPVDAGGNEGPASNVIRISFDETGCAATGVPSANLLPVGLLLVWLIIQAHRRRSLSR